jgi:acyl-CoA thioesterase-1
MSRFIGFLWLLLVLAASVPARAAPAPVLLVFGDSLSAGYGLRPDQGWVDLLGQRLVAEGYEFHVVNASVSGETTAGGLARLPRALELHRPAIVVLELGANDGLRGLPVAAMKHNLAAIIERSNKAGARVLLVGMRLPPNYGEQYTRAFEHAFAELAKSQRAALLPFLLEGFGDKEELFQPDRIHPTERAQPAVLKNVWGKLAPLLRKK